MVDRYTKAVLTVIAVSLAVLAFRGIGAEKAVAQSGEVHVIVDSVDKYAFKYSNAIPVSCTNCQ
jgi:hypothetical protein